jgi:hypothetical protein
MFLLDVLFGSRKKPKNTPIEKITPGVISKPAGINEQHTVNAPGTQIHHDTDLIAQLKDDHVQLLEIYTAIDAAAKVGDFGQVALRLGNFRTALTDHLLKENVRLYVYLEHMLVDDETSHLLMREFRHEMDAIGLVVVAFLGKYKLIATQPELTNSFAADLASIGEALVARIHREESTLYAMYIPPTP